MGEEQGYNGWANYETWVVVLWIDNEESSYDEARDIVRGTDRIQAADNLKSWVEESLPDLGGSLAQDLLTSAFGEVDWIEIAENYLSEVEQDA